MKKSLIETVGADIIRPKGGNMVCTADRGVQVADGFPMRPGGRMGGRMVSAPTP